MKKLLIISLLLLLTTIPSHAQQGASKKVKFVLYAPGLPEDSTVYITGSAPQVGNWDPGKVAMKSEGNHTWSITLNLPAQASLEYKYTLGSWEREGTDKDGLPLPNRILHMKDNSLVKDTVDYWIAKKERPVVGGITGKVNYHKAVKGADVQERDLIVWLPPGYKEHPERKYPVLYMHDGQNIFDPATSSYGVDWQLDETADSLIKAGAIEPLIIVGINNTSDRNEEYIPGKKGTAYMNYVVDVIKPLIDKQYRTKPGRENTAVGGSSAGGIMAFMLAWEHPDVFSKVISMSPAFKIQDIDYVKDVQAYKGRKKDLLLYIDNGGIDLEERLQPGIDDMLKALKAKGYQENKDFVWVKAPQDQHSEAAWARRMPDALKLLFPAKKKEK